MSIDLPSVLEKLPPFSPATEKLLASLQKDLVNASEVERLLIACPVIAGRLLQMANSSFYGFSREITSLREAFVILGQQTVQNLVYTMAVIEQFAGQRQAEPTEEARLVESIWLHSLYSACFARVWTTEQKLNANDAFTAALFQHLGLVILIHCEAKIVLERLHSLRASPMDILGALEQVSGWNHCSLSASALEIWRFPVSVCELINPHASSMTEERNAILLGNCLADAQGFTLAPQGFMPPPCEALLRQLTSKQTTFTPLMSQTDALFAEMRQGLLS